MYLRKTEGTGRGRGEEWGEKEGLKSKLRVTKIKINLLTGVTKKKTKFIDHKRTH